MTTKELIEKYGIGFNCLADAYDFGYRNGKVDTLEQYICHDDCESENCSMCCRWNRLSDCYVKGEAE